MNPFFSALSAAYIFAIFFWADTPVVSQIEIFNPFSLLHIPLYGILTLFLLLAFGPAAETNTRFWYILAASLATAVGILDEFHQSFYPQRDASMTDIFLDVSGVALVMVYSHRVPPLVWMDRFRKFLRRTPWCFMCGKEILSSKEEKWKKGKSWDRFSLYF